MISFGVLLLFVCIEVLLGALLWYRTKVRGRK